MRRSTMILATALTGLVMLTGCGSPGVSADPEAAAARGGGSPSEPGPGGAAGDWPDGVKEAEVYTAVLRRYLLNSNDNSIPDARFTTAYVLDRTDPGGLIPASTQRKVVDAVSGTVPVVFIADRTTVVDDKNGCPQVKNGGILIELGRPDGDDNEVKVRVQGFVACLGGTTLTYAVRREDGTGWRVTGTVGPIAVA